VEGHHDLGRVALAVEHEAPVVAEGHDQPRPVVHPALRPDLARLDQVDHREQHQRLVRRRSASFGSRDIEGAETAEPIGVTIVHDLGSRIFTEFHSHLTVGIAWLRVPSMPNSISLVFALDKFNGPFRYQQLALGELQVL